MLQLIFANFKNEIIKLGEIYNADGFGDSSDPKFAIKQIIEKDGENEEDIEIYLIGFNYIDADCYVAFFAVTDHYDTHLFFYNNGEHEGETLVTLEQIEITGNAYKWYNAKVKELL